jgi:cell division protease FtsH
MSSQKHPKRPKSDKIGDILIWVASILAISYTLFAVLPPQFKPRFLKSQQSPQITPSRIVPYSTFVENVNQDKVKVARIQQNVIMYQLKGTENQPGEVLATTPIPDLGLVKRLEEKGVEFFTLNAPPQNPWLGTIVNWVIPPVIFVLVFQFFMNRNQKADLAFGKSKAKEYIEGESEKVTFNDVAGVEEAKIELAEIVEFLKNPQKFAKIGARIPKGVLLVGPPGTGKTLLSKAVAGEAGVPFYSISASEFVEMFVGTGAARVRDLFKRAKKEAPCIIFIDELDAIGKTRNSGTFQSGSNDEREQTLNQLLTEMDGFNASEAVVIVLAATNRPEALDAALLRPGRFDRQVLVDRPDLAGRLQILEIYAKKVTLADNLDLKTIATRTSGFSGADLANLVNEAALLAARNQRENVTQEDFYEAFERVIIGLEKKSRVLSDKEKKIVAYHEVGHAIVGAVIPGQGKVTKISIIPRGFGALGYALTMPTEDRFLIDEVECRQKIAMSLGGRAAEELVFGKVTNGASSDLQFATRMAEKMVTIYGMSKVLGPLAYEISQDSFLNNTTNIRRIVSDETDKEIDHEVKEIVENAYQQALNILTQNRDLLEAIAAKILETEVIEGEELENLLNQTKPLYL